MNFLFDNPIANMPGALFLVFYGIIIVFSAIVFYFFKSRIDWTSNQSAPLIPPNPDPFEIAFLRGGENEFARALVFGLTQKGFLKITNESDKSYIALAENQPNWTTLSMAERSALPWFQTTRETGELFKSGGLVEELRPYSMTYEQKITQNYLLTPNDVSVKTRIFSLLFLGAVLALGGYKLVAALMNGRTNIILLIVFLVIAAIIFLALGKTKRLSERGRKYIAGLQYTFEKLKHNQTSMTPAPTFNAVDPMLLAVGVFGTSVLIGTGYSEYEQAFHRSSAASSGGGCGSGCGSSSCSSGGDGGSSCGGGCGGCGGGGD